MIERNCVNCGAVIETEAVKCPYCGTSYFDFTNIELDGKPVVLKLKHNNQIFILNAICTSCNITTENHPLLYSDGIRKQSLLNILGSLKLDSDISSAKLPLTITLFH